MRTRVTIGDFSRASYLSVKTLRHYHEIGLLEPSEVDPDNGYRHYSEDQIPLAQHPPSQRPPRSASNRPSIATTSSAGGKALLASSTRPSGRRA